VTASLVRRTLDPLVQGKSADDILRLRVLDMAMGSGAFLVGACRYLAAAAEDALIRDGRWHEADVTVAERAALRREIAQRCLFGVDLNPMAVQLARLSLWLVTLASEKPLTFLDHHLVAGDSLLGASLDDVRRQPPGGRIAARRHEPLPLFDETGLEAALEDAVRSRIRLATEPDDSAAIVRDKERTLLALHAYDSPLGRWSRLLDLWCAGWFWENGDGPDARMFAELSDRVLRNRSTLPERMTDRVLEQSERTAQRHRFLHWPIAFPEVFWDERGDPLPDAGFDVVVGNPPWDMVRGDSGDDAIRAGRRDAARRLTDFVREAGIYRIESRSHVNRYQLFVERALQLTKAGGRIGLVLPAGVVTDTGAAGLRRQLFDQSGVDSVTGLDNRNGVFPIHRSARFVLLTTTRGQPTGAIACRFGLTRAEELEQADGCQAPLVLSRRFLSRVSGEDDLGIPELSTEQDLRIVERISARHAWLGSPDGWHVRFGRELNATDDRRLFVPFSGRSTARPVLEGKQIEPFRVCCEASRYELQGGASRTRVPRRARLAYRDVASATNRVTLIAAIVPARAVTTHTLFCLKTPLSTDAEHVLCALMNSFVANYLIRLRVNTHVTASLVSRLPVPFLAPTDPAFFRLARLARSLAEGTEPAEEMPEYAELQAQVADLYGLDADAFAHILGTFPIIPGEIRSRALFQFSSLH
jgi:methylase of polypeptide subunit release factors